MKIRVIKNITSLPLTCIFTMFLSMFFTSTYAQQWNQNTLLSYNIYKDNPAYAGFDQSISLTGLSRNQWVSLAGRPSYRYLGAHLPVYVWKAGIGSDFQLIQEGSFNFRSARFSFNRVINIPMGILSLGARANVNYLSIDGKSIKTPEGIYTDGIFNHNDPSLANNLAGAFGVGWEFGAFLRQNKYQLGLSLANLPSNTISVKDARITMRNNLSFYFQYIFDYSESIQFQPSIHINSDFLYTQSQINALTRINGNIFGGMSLRGYSSSSIDAVGFILGHKLNKRYSVFYSYDLGISSLSSVHEGSHELMLKINFYKLPGTGLPPKIIFNPRFLGI